MDIGVVDVVVCRHVWYERTTGRLGHIAFVKRFTDGQESVHIRGSSTRRAEMVRKGVSVALKYVKKMSCSNFFSFLQVVRSGERPCNRPNWDESCCSCSGGVVVLGSSRSKNPVWPFALFIADVLGLFLFNAEPPGM